MSESERRDKKMIDGDSAVSADQASAGKGLLAEIRDTGFIGMWKDRQDIEDSSVFARRLRERAQAPIDPDLDPEDK